MNFLGGKRVWPFYNNQSPLIMTSMFFLQIFPLHSVNHQIHLMTIAACPVERGGENKPIRILIPATIVPVLMITLPQITEMPSCLPTLNGNKQLRRNLLWVEVSLHIYFNIQRIFMYLNSICVQLTQCILFWKHKSYIDNDIVFYNNATEFLYRSTTSFVLSSDFVWFF